MKLRDFMQSTKYDVILCGIWLIMHNYAIIQNYAILRDFMKIMRYRIDRVKSSSLLQSQPDPTLSLAVW